MTNSATEVTPAADVPGANLVVLNSRRGPDLSSVMACRRELSRIYRLVRRGKLPVSEGTRYAYLLNTIAELVERGELEERIRQIEQRVTLVYDDAD